MATLPTNFKDDILDTSVNTRRRYRVYENTDGTIELEDVTEYSQVGDEFGAGQINATNTEVNKKFDKNMIVRDLDTINAISKEGYIPDALALKEVNDSLGGLQFGVDENGNYGYIKAGADSVTPFSSGIYKFAYLLSRGSNSTVIASNDLSFTVEITKTYKVIPICYSNGYISGTIKIKKNGTVIKTLTAKTGNDYNFTEFELSLEKGDSIEIEVTKSTNNASMFGGFIFV